MFISIGIGFETGIANCTGLWIAIFIPTKRIYFIHTNKITSNSIIRQKEHLKLYLLIGWWNEIVHLDTVRGFDARNDLIVQNKQCFRVQPCFNGFDGKVSL